MSHQYGETAGSDRRNSDPATTPLGTVTAGGGHHNLVTPFVVYNYDHNGGDQRRIKSTDSDPLGTVVANGRHEQLVTPMIVQRRDYDGPDASRVHSTSAEPLGARTAAGRGIDGLVTPMLTEFYGKGGSKPVDEPLGTVSTRGHHALVVPAGGTWNEDARSTEEPLRTRTTRDMEGMATPPQFVDVARANNRSRDPETDALAPVTTGLNQAVVTPDPYVTVARRNSRAVDPGADALATVTGGGNHHELVSPFLSKHHGGMDYPRIEHMSKPITEPMPAVVTRPNISLVTPSRAPRIDVDMDAIDKIDIADWHFRMLTWREHANAQRFPTGYEFTGNGSENTLMAGNAVASNVAHYLGVLTRIAFDDLPADILGYDLEKVPA
jgi:DNA (cytosine-5)-methyltransferase 1